jgi:hypothetical protein
MQGLDKVIFLGNIGPHMKNGTHKTTINLDGELYAAIVAAHEKFWIGEKAAPVSLTIRRLLLIGLKNTQAKGLRHG